MQYANPSDAVVTGDTFMINPVAVRIGAIGAKVYTARNEVAMNPFKPETAAWMSFNLGARKYLEGLPNEYPRGHKGGDPSEGFYFKFTSDEHSEVAQEFFKRWSR